MHHKGGITLLHAGYHGNILVGKKQENCRSLSILYDTMVTCMQRCNSSLTFHEKFQAIRRSLQNGILETDVTST